jgi:hypothetical protein
MVCCVLPPPYWLAIPSHCTALSALTDMTDMTRSLSALLCRLCLGTDLLSLLLLRELGPEVWDPEHSTQFIGYFLDPKNHEDKKAPKWVSCAYSTAAEAPLFLSLG